MNWKHWFTASREGDNETRTKYLANAIKFGIIIILSFFAWLILRNWFFSEFNPFSYWMINKNFWSSLITVLIPMAIYAIFLGQLDWFSNDEFENKTIVSENIFFKTIISFFAGLWEELGYRGLFIYFGLIVVFLNNLFFNWIILLVLIILFIVIVINKPNLILALIIFD